MRLRYFFPALLIYITLSCSVVYSATTGFAQITNPNGIAVDQQGNVYIQSLSILGDGGLFKFTPEGSVASRDPSLTGEFRFTFDSVNNLIWAIETQGNLYVIDPQTMAVYFVGNIINTLPSTPSAYNILTKQYTPLIMVSPQFGDIALYHINENNFNLFITGLTAQGGIPFVVRVRYESNAFKDTTVVGASIPLPNPIYPPPLGTQPAGIAVNSNGKILTTFPINIDPNTGVMKIFLATIGADFPENPNAPPAFVTNLYGKQVFSMGMTDSALDKGFYMVTVANGLGCGFGPALMHFDQNVNNATCMQDFSTLGLGELQPDDVSLSPDNSKLYVSIRPRNLVLQIDNTPPPVSNVTPIANAGPDQTVNVGNKVILNGSGSHDPDSGPSPLSYSWAQTGGPAVTLSNAATATPSFTPSTPGAYTFNLVVNDGNSNSAADSVAITVNDVDYVKIQSPNGGEVWNEGNKQTIIWQSHRIAGNAKLSLYTSIDNGNSWTKIATVKNIGTKTWKIPKNRYISKQALLKVCVKPNETVCDVSDAVFAINKAPIAEAGVKQNVGIGAIVTLNGTASSDADNGPSPLNFQWKQIGGPLVTLNNANTPTPSFTALSKGVCKFGLTVNDGAATSKIDKVSVKIVNP